MDPCVMKEIRGNDLFGIRNGIIWHLFVIVTRRKRKKFGKRRNQIKPKYLVSRLADSYSVRAPIDPKLTVSTPHMPHKRLQLAHWDTFTVIVRAAMPSSLAVHTFWESFILVISFPCPLITILRAGPAQILPQSRRYDLTQMNSSLWRSQIETYNLLSFPSLDFWTLTFLYRYLLNVVWFVWIYF